MQPANPALVDAVSPSFEMGAYEYLWDQAKASFKLLAEHFRRSPGSKPSDLVPTSAIAEYKDKTLGILLRAGIERFGVCVNSFGEYPDRLRDAANPIELFYYQGDIDLVTAPRAVAIVGTRQATDEGKRRAARIAGDLVERGVVIVSGLARGIDTIAHRTAIERGGYTIAVMGTPLGEVYPAENADLQKEIATKHLLVSQVPVCRYSRQTPNGNRFFFPERNVTMSALSDATIIVEASDTSGTLIQARAALDQGRKLFILNSCFENPNINWPKRLEAKGAIRISETAEIVAALYGDS